MRHWIAVIAAAVCLCGCQHHASGDQAAATASGGFSPGIVAKDLATHVRALADIRNGNQGDGQIIDYAIAQFQRMGLSPGDDGHWVQEVPYLETTLSLPQDVRLRIEGTDSQLELAYGNDMLVGSPASLAHAALEQSQVVFVGYGVNAPDQQWNDYANIDVRGKTVIVLSNDPGWHGRDPSLFKGRNFTHYGLWAYKLEEAARQGAAAAFIVHDEAEIGSPWRNVQNAWKRPQLSLPARDGERRLPVAGWLSGDAAQRLFTMAGMNFQDLRKRAGERGFQPVPLRLAASIAFDSAMTPKHTYNIVARVNGTKQPNEAIIYTAHWDKVSHNSNPIRRAVDSGSGLAGMLEIAEAFAHSAPKPHRSVLFVATALGDAGMLGSRYYVDHPAIPLRQTVAAINLDTLPIAGRDRTIALIGYGQSQLDDYLEAAAKMHHRTVTPDQAPERGFFFRSDQINFANAGVPVLYASSSTQHTILPDSDAPPFDLAGATEDLRMLFTVGEKLSLEASYPQWKPHSDFKRPDTAESTKH
ncbi:MAG TPA: M28 family peptidase [Dyella sp.]|uniref:M28 family peptidase n=1 Tax=Dyella sp. TaxID=1869338 RepID=UPI002F9417E4